MPQFRPPPATGADRAAAAIRELDIDPEKLDPVLL